MMTMTWWGRSRLLLVAGFIVASVSTAAGAASMACYQCHGSSGDYRPLDSAFRAITTGGFAGNHRTHMATPASPAACGSCHPGSSSYTASHRDGWIKVAGRINDSSLVTPYRNSTSAFRQSPSPVPGSCNAVNCHFESPTPVWGSSPSGTTCSTCHGAPPSGDAGNGYAGGDAGSHGRHGEYYSGAGNCVKCHVDHTVEPSPFAHATSGGKRGLVVTGSYSAAFSAITAYLPSRAASHRENYGTCSNTYCHGSTLSREGDRNGGTNTVPTWGDASTAQCGSCHGATSANPPLRGSHKTHVSAGQAYFTPVSGGKPVPPSPAFYYIYGRQIGCTVCHSGYTGVHVNGKADWRFDAATQPLLRGALYRGMSSGSIAPVPSTPSWQCTNLYCHSIGQSATGGPLSGQPGEYASPTWGNVDDGRCGTCHAADNMHAYVYGGMPQASPEISSGSHTKHLQSLGGIPGGADRCARCHNYGGSDTLNGCASTCHNNGALHVNYRINVAFPPMYGGTAYTGTEQPGDGYGGCSGISCHGGTSAQWGAGACLDCHSVAQGKRVAVTSQFSGGSHHVQGEVSNGHCYQCHWEANMNGTINAAYHSGAASPGAPVDLVVYGAGSRPASYQLAGAATAVQYTANGSRGEIQKVSTHCLGCHRDENNATVPFGDGKTPRQYAWDGTSVAARYSQAATTAWGKYTSASLPNVAKKKIAKALSPHGNAGANERGWNTTTGVDGTIANTSGAVGVQCYDCHNSHGSAVAGITSRYSSATGRNRGGILKQTVRGFGGYSTTYVPVAGGSAGEKNYRNPGASLCLDCHLSSTPKQALAFRGYTTPWGYTSTYGASQAIIGYWDSPFMTSGIDGSKQRYVYKQDSLVKGGHFGASVPLSSSPASGIDGLCTPCHDPHGVSPTLGSDMQYAVPLLKGTWVTSPYKEDAAPQWNSPQIARNWYSTSPYRIDQNSFGARPNDAIAAGIREPDSRFAGLCLSCHAKGSLTDGVTHTWKSKDRIHESVKGWKTANGTVKHTYTCSKCHSPHTNAVLPRLMVTNCLDNKHKGRLGLNYAPVLQGSSSGDWGEGSGHFPGSYSSYGDSSPGNYPSSCHEGNTGNVNDQGWNVVTPWSYEPPITITSGPTVSNYTASYLSGAGGTISWNTSLAASTFVDYGLTASYGSTAGTADLVKNHVQVVNNLENHTTYHYRVRSVSYSGRSIASADQSFSISLPPTVPTLDPRADALCTGSCAVTLQWNASQDIPDNGPVEYYAEADTTSAFNSINRKNSGWISGTNWTPSLSTANTWYWRVKARDGGHPKAVSAWSTASSFRLTTALPPPASTIVNPGSRGYASDCVNPVPVVLEWTAVAAPDADPVDYNVELNGALQGWQAGTSLTIQAPPEGYFTWRVLARDTIHPDAISWSATDAFGDGGGCWSGSCPLVFASDGTSFRYVTDLQGPVLGLGSATLRKDVGIFQPIYTVLYGLAADGGNEYRVKVRESLPEISYLDEIRLLAVDYPKGYQIETSGGENTYHYGYVNPFRIYTVRNPVLPLSATDRQGNDILARLTAVDDNPAPLSADGSLDYYTLDFGPIARPEYAKLLIDGWSVYGVKKFVTDQVVQPFVEVVDHDGNWVKVKSFGTPAGDLKTMVVDLSNLFISQDHRIRIHVGVRTASRWLADRVRLDDSAPVAVSVRELQHSAGTLHEEGRAVRAMSTMQHRLIAEDINLPLIPEALGYGRFTRLGDVGELLADRDDKYVIMRHGDTLDMVFPSPGEPAEGIKRGFVLKGELYYKVFDNNNEVEPIPYRGMQSYPYAPPDTYPVDGVHQLYLQQYNTREYLP